MRREEERTDIGNVGGQLAGRGRGASGREILRVDPDGAVAVGSQ